MKKQVTVVMIVESEDEINMSDRFIRQDLEQEIACASNYYEVVDIKTEIISEMMAEIPKVSNCPIRCEEDSICMCAVRKCTDVDLRECFQMRSAYSHGFRTAEDIAIKNMDEIKNTIDGMIKRID